MGVSPMRRPPRRVLSSLAKVAPTPLSARVAFSRTWPFPRSHTPWSRFLYAVKVSRVAVTGALLGSLGVVTGA